MCVHARSPRHPSQLHHRSSGLLGCRHLRSRPSQFHDPPLRPAPWAAKPHSIPSSLVPAQFNEFYRQCSRRPSLHPRGCSHVSTPDGMLFIIGTFPMLSEKPTSGHGITRLPKDFSHGCRMFPLSPVQRHPVPRSADRPVSIPLGCAPALPRQACVRRLPTVASSSASIPSASDAARTRARGPPRAR